jgi:hypothetical protein
MIGSCASRRALMFAISSFFSFASADVFIVSARARAIYIVHRLRYTMYALPPPPIPTPMRHPPTSSGPYSMYTHGIKSGYDTRFVCAPIPIRLYLKRALP